MKHIKSKSLDVNITTMDERPTGEQPPNLANGDIPIRDAQIKQSQNAKLIMYLFVVSLAVMFSALVMLYLLRLDVRRDYFFQPPKVLWLSTALLLLSSMTCHAALKAVAKDKQSSFLIWMNLTLLLGVGFLASQMFAWYALIERGVFAQTNPFSGLFYVITFIHGVHLLAGLVWLGYVRYLGGRGVFTAGRHLAVDLSTIYWHFMDVAWIVFFLLIMFL